MMPDTREIALVDPPTLRSRSGGERDATTARKATWHAASSSTSACHEAASIVWRANQLDPFSGNDPRFSPVSRRRAAYFQYAAWTVISWMLWRPCCGRQAASSGLTPRIDPRRLVPCQDLLS